MSHPDKPYRSEEISPAVCWTCAEPRCNHQGWLSSAPLLDNHWNGSAQAANIALDVILFELRHCYRGQIIFRPGRSVSMKIEVLLQAATIADPLRVIVESCCWLVELGKDQDQGPDYRSLHICSASRASKQ